MHGCQSFYWGLDDCLGKKSVLRDQLAKKAVKLSLLKRDETSWDVVALSTILSDENGLQWKGHIQLTSFFLLSSEVKRSRKITPLWEETVIQDNEKLIYRWETKRFALLTSCWLPVELHLVAVSFGFVVACHQMALGWWIHFQGNYIGTFWQWHLPNAWKQ